MINDLRSAALISFILVVPFLILESVNTTLTRQNAPGLILLFGLLWLLPTAFLLILFPMARKLHAGSTNPVIVVPAVAFMVVLALAWGGLLIDQMPCFLGVPNCD